MNSRLDLKYSHTIGLVAMEGRGFSNPVDLAIASDGLIYVVSRTNPLQPYGIRVGICNLDSDYIGDFGSFGSEDGQFIWPTALAFDSDDRLYMADEYNHRITVFDRAGNFLSSWGALGDASGKFNGPSGIACDAEDNLYVVDHLNNRVQKFTTQGRHLLEWGTEGGADGYFNLPWGVTVDSVGNVYVADWRNDRIQKFSQDGKFLAKFAPPDKRMASSIDPRPWLWTPTVTCTSPIGAMRGCRFWAPMEASSSGYGARLHSPGGPRNSSRPTRTKNRPGTDPTWCLTSLRKRTHLMRSRPGSSVISGVRRR